MDGSSPSASKSFAVPISKFQADVLRLLAAQRNPDSYIAGGALRGLWPSSPEIPRAMLKLYGKPNLW